VHFYPVHYDPRYFSDPDMFWPERWRAFILFSYGASNCVGKGLALQQMKSAVCHVMAKLNVRFADWYNPEVWELLGGAGAG